MQMDYLFIYSSLFIHEFVVTVNLSEIRVGRHPKLNNAVASSVSLTVNSSLSVTNHQSQSTSAISWILILVDWSAKSPEAGDYFGELALILDAPRAASVVASSEPEAGCSNAAYPIMLMLWGMTWRLMKQWSDGFWRMELSTLQHLQDSKTQNLRWSWHLARCVCCPWTELRSNASLANIAETSARQWSPMQRSPYPNWTFAHFRCAAWLPWSKHEPLWVNSILKSDKKNIFLKLF